MTVRFAPRPENDFARFIALYWDECRARVPQIAAIAGKWRFEDLIPGLSDFDTRFIVSDDMSVDGWCAMSGAVGEVHLDLCRRYPHWARNLEHLPGMNVTWRELTDPDLYYPEYRQWTFHESAAPARLAAAQEVLAARPWDERDLVFHLKKFCMYFGRYDRRIDPPVNCREFESKYPLHSRFMHYFCPPLQSALSILLKRPIAGKMESVRLACEMFSEPVFREMRDAVERHYETPALYEEPELTRLEDRLEAALEMLRRRLAPDAAAVVPDPERKSVGEWKAELDRRPIRPSLRVLDATRFSRLMKGRLLFYARAPEHFDSAWLIENELRRMKRNFFEIPFGVCWEALIGEKIGDPAQILSRLGDGPFTAEQMRCVRGFVRLTSCVPARERLKATALELADVFDGFFHALDRVVRRIGELEATPCA